VEYAPHESIPAPAAAARPTCSASKCESSPYKYDDHDYANLRQAPLVLDLD
jgi:hypothetical protein